MKTLILGLIVVLIVGMLDYEGNYYYRKFYQLEVPAITTEGEVYTPI